MKYTLPLISLCFFGIVGFAAPAEAETTGALFPSADGSFNQWKTSPSESFHYKNVDETACDGNLTRNYTTTVGEKDSYAINLASVPDGAVINKIKITPCASRFASKVGSSRLGLFYKVDSQTLVHGSSYSLSGTTPTVLLPTQFSNLSLAKGSETKLEVGVHYLSGTAGVKVSSLRVEVDYTVSVQQPPLAPTNLYTTSTSTQSGLWLRWTDNAFNESGFVVERSAAVTGPFTVLGTANARPGIGDSASFSILQPQVGVNYYRVYAFNSFGNSGYSNVVSRVWP